MSEPRKIQVVVNEEDESGLASNGSVEPASSAKAQAEGNSSGGGESQPSAGQSLEDVQSKLDAREKDYKEAYDRLLRVTAEFENYKKRLSREMEDFRKYANQSPLRRPKSATRCFWSRRTPTWADGLPS